MSTMTRQGRRQRECDAESGARFDSDERALGIAGSGDIPAPAAGCQPSGNGHGSSPHAFNPYNELKSFTTTGRLAVPGSSI